MDILSGTPVDIWLCCMAVVRSHLKHIGNCSFSKRKKNLQGPVGPTRLLLQACALAIASQVSQAGLKMLKKKKGLFFIKTSEIIFFFSPEALK